MGSYFLLGEILLGIQLEPDVPFEADRCGKCTRCINACPTKCILPDRTIEARLCISYLTIENKKEIPADLDRWWGTGFLAAIYVSRCVPGTGLHPRLLILLLVTIQECPTRIWWLNWSSPLQNLIINLKKAQLCAVKGEDICATSLLRWAIQEAQLKSKPWKLQ